MGKEKKKEKHRSKKEPITVSFFSAEAERTTERGREEMHRVTK